MGIGRTLGQHPSTQGCAGEVPPIPSGGTQGYQELPLVGPNRPPCLLGDSGAPGPWQGGLNPFQYGPTLIELARPPQIWPGLCWSRPCFFPVLTDQPRLHCTSMYTELSPVLPSLNPEEPHTYRLPSEHSTSSLLPPAHAIFT